jgi:branched-chain amino acid aminotransferase
VCSSDLAAEVIPVVKVDCRTIGTGKPGEITKSLIKSFHELTRQQTIE